MTSWNKYYTQTHCSLQQGERDRQRKERMTDGRREGGLQRYVRGLLSMIKEGHEQEGMMS